MTETLRLHYAPDNASLCVRLALETIGAAYEITLVDRGRKAQRSPDYLTLNPNGLIPTLETPDGVMFETGAILLWLADRNPEKLMPSPDAPTRGEALTWLFWLSNTLHPSLRMMFYPVVYAEDEDGLRRVARPRINTHLHVLDQAWPMIQAHEALRCYTAPMLRWLGIYGGNPSWFDLSQFANLSTFAKAYETTQPAVRLAVADGLGQTPFSNPSLPNPPEGSAL